MKNEIMDWIRQQVGVQSPSKIMRQRTENEILPMWYLLLDRYRDIFAQADQEAEK